MKTILPAALALVLFACQPSSDRFTPLVDGRIEDFQKLGVEPVQIDENVDLYLYQNDHNVWLAYTYPDGSYGTCDLYLSTEKLEEPVNLHVSAQLGQWPANSPEMAPDVPNSDQWWNHDGWYANEIWPNGFVMMDGLREMNFKNATAREFQFTKEKFGRGTWKMRFDIRAIKTTDGMKSIRYPLDSAEFFTYDVF